MSNNLDTLLNQHFAGKVVRKNLTKLIREGANVPVFVLEYLLGQHCASDDEEIIQEGFQSVKEILASNFIRPDEAEKVKSYIKEQGSYKIIDKVTVTLNEKKDTYEALLSNLGTKGVQIPDGTVTHNEKLLAGGIWSIITIQYFYEENSKFSPFYITDLKPIQMPNMDMDEFYEGRRGFNEEQWIDVLMRSIGMEPAQLSDRVKWHLLARMVPFVENNYNVCELGPRGTGKSYIYKESSPYSILVSGGQTTVANLFYNMASRVVGLVGFWDIVAFDEVAGIKFKDSNGVAIMKDFMASGSFSRGKDAVHAPASMVFVGNIGGRNKTIPQLVKTSHLLEPFPEEMIDPAFFDRMHSYIPGWEIPIMRPEYFTDKYGLIVDYLAEFLREMRKKNFTDGLDKYFILGKALNQRDVIAVRKTFSGLIKLIYPNGDFDKEAARRCLEYALETRQRVKIQLWKIGGEEFEDFEFSYKDKETDEETIIEVREYGSKELIHANQRKLDEESEEEKSPPEEKKESKTPKLEPFKIPDTENPKLEFKSTARYNLNTKQRDERLELVIVKTMAGFLNADGGTLLIGVKEIKGGENEVIGLSKDFSLFPKGDSDDFSLWLSTFLNECLGKNPASEVKINFEDINGKEICKVTVGDRYLKPVYVNPPKTDNIDDFYIRQNTQTIKLSIKETVEYIRANWG